MSILPNVDISPKGLRELEAWLRRPEKRDEPDQWYYVLPYAPATKPADYRVADPHPDFEGSWGNASSSDFATGFGVSRIGRQKKLWIKLAVTGGEDDPGSTIFTLPNTFRPEKTHRMIVRQGETDGALIDVNPDGTVVYVGKLTAVSLAAIEALGFIHFGTNNGAGSGLDIDTVGGGMNWLLGGGGFSIDTEGGSVNVTADGGMDVTTDDSAFNVSTTGGSIDLNGGTDGDIDIRNTGTSADIDINAGHALTLQSQGSTGISVSAAAGPVVIGAADDISVQLAAGQPFTLKDSFGNPMLQMTEGSPDLHLQAGASIAYDL